MTPNYYTYQDSTKSILRRTILWSYLFLLLGGTALFLSSCKQFVDIPPPATKLVTVSVFNNNSTATSAVTSIYSQMANTGESSNRAYETGLLSDELSNYSNAVPSIQLYTNSLSAINGNSYGTWSIGSSSFAYYYIYQANAALSALQNNEAIAPAINNQLTGEAKFIRAFWYFYLVNYYGDVPLALTADYAINSTLPRTPKAQVYAQIIADLQDAQTLLNGNYVDASDTAVTTDRVRPTRWAATALLARTYLYQGNKWDSAEAEATAVINNHVLYGLPTDLNTVFLANSQEAIWQLAVPQPFSGINTEDGFHFILIASPSRAGNPQTISPWLLNSFEPNDARKADWIGTFTDTTVSPAIPYYFPYKYKVYQSANITEYTMILRLAEQYLIRAEARAQQGNLAGAAQDLNTIRNRAGLPNSTAVTQSDLLAAILHERQVELFTEWGHRWFDLIRTGNANAVMGNPGGVCHSKGGTWNPNGYQQLLPVPQTEINADPNLSQNRGY